MLPALLAVLGLLLAGRATAQTFTTLHSFTFTGFSDGANPAGGLILLGNKLYGTARYGGNPGVGTVFTVNTDGTSFTNLHKFAALHANSSGIYTNSDGLNPVGALVLSGNTLFGTTQTGGSFRSGPVFAINTDGTGFTNLHIFTTISSSSPYTNSDGGGPVGGLILSGNTLFGTAATSGSFGYGTLFAINTDGTGFTNLHNFTAISSSYSYINSDGAYPQAGLVLAGNTLYGTATSGGGSGNGNIFKVNTDGTSFTNLYSFTATLYPSYTNSDGANPGTGLTLSGNILYGTAPGGGSSSAGTVFAVNTNGTGFRNLHSFTAGFANSDGANPQAGLILSGNTLYGTTYQGGSPGNGTVFAVNTSGTGFTNLHNFNGFPSDGRYPSAGLLLMNNTLYGTAYYGGSWDHGTVFSLTLPWLTQISIISSGANVTLMWPTNAGGFTLQSTTNLAPPALWSTNSPAPVIVNGQFTVTNPITGDQQFYRLSQ